MLRHRRIRRLWLGLLVALAGGPALGADQVTPRAPATVQPGRAGVIIVSGLSGAERILTPQDIGSLPTVRVTVAVEPGHGPPQRTYEGPLLWALLDRAGVVETAKFHAQVREAVIATGSDGYSVVLALGEISPEFEGKQAIVAERVDGHPLAAGHFRLVVPGERRAGRSARDLIRISVVEPH